MRGHGPKPVLWLSIWKACVERRKEKPHVGNLAWKVRRPIAYMPRLRKTEQKEEPMLEPRSDAKVEVIEQCHKGVRMFLEHLPTSNTHTPTA